MNEKKISFIGLGAMGQPMASNIVRKGTALTVYDIDTARMEPVVALGASAAASVAEAVAGADIVITMLPATQHVEQVVTGPDGVLANLEQGSLVLDMSTIAPTGTDRIAQACAGKGVAFVDAPVGRLALSRANAANRCSWSAAMTRRASSGSNRCWRQWARPFTVAAASGRVSAPRS